MPAASGQPPGHTPAPDLMPDPPPARAVWPLVLLALALALPEALFLGADAGLWGSRIWRQTCWQYGGFWAGLWRGWEPNYPAQPWAMILTYSLLHAGPGHLAGNLAGLWAAAGALRPRFGPGQVLAVWAAGVLGGGLAFGVLATSPAPMIGASGAVFGLVGAWWWADTARPRPLPCRVLRAAGLCLLLIAVNVAMFAASAAGIAWETHLGGFLAGAALAAILPRRRPGSGRAAAAQEGEPAETEREKRQ